MTEQQKKLGLVAATSLVLGNIVGVMIFLTQSTVAKHLPWNHWVLWAWILGGFLAVAGALSLAELGAMMPQAGGDYIYLRKAFGERMAFLSGWTSVCITFPGSIAALAVGLCYFQGPLLLGEWLRHDIFQWKIGTWTYSLQGAQVMSLFVIVLFTGINHIGVRLSGRLQTIITAGPVLFMLMAAVGVFWVTPSGPLPPMINTSQLSPWPGLWFAVVPIFFAYAGWNVTTYIGSEIERPERNIPLSLIFGTSLALLVYVMITWVFLQGVPAAAMPAAQPTVASLALHRLFGSWAGQWLAPVIALAVLSSLNATILGGARISYAMAHNGLAFRQLQETSPRFQTPVPALWFQAGLSALLVLTGRFEQLVDYVTGMMLAFSSITIAAVFVLRFRSPEIHRPYKTWGYPVIPALYILFCLAILVGMCLNSPKQVAWGFGISMLGLPVYSLMTHQRNNPTL